MHNQPIFQVPPIILYTVSIHSGALDLLLPGYDNIPTDGSGLILITDIGTSPSGADEDGDALICRHNITDTPGLGDWYYNGTEEADVVDGTDNVLGWKRNRGQAEGVVRLRSLSDTPQRGDSVEGVYSCVVQRGADVDVVSVGLYYNSKCTTWVVALAHCKCTYLP